MTDSPVEETFEMSDVDFLGDVRCVVRDVLCSK